MDTIEELEQKVNQMKGEIDAMQVSIAGQSKPWYRNVSTILAAVALLFSFGTTYVSYRRTAVQDVQSLRQELRGLLQRLASLPKENVDIQRRYADDPAVMGLVSGYINQENTLLARQAAELAKKLPSDSVSAIEYYAIGLALQNAYDTAAAGEFFEYSNQTAKDFNTEISALRSTATLRFIQGQPESGRVEYQKALNVFSKYPGYDLYTKTSTNIWTELSWAGSEYTVGRKDLATQHIESARTLLSRLPPSPGQEMLGKQVSQAEDRFGDGHHTNAPVVRPEVDIVPMPGTK
jgi:hypothetical protein